MPVQGFCCTFTLWAKLLAFLACECNSLGAMNEDNTRSSRPDAPPAGGAADDHLPTTRLPPVSAPPVHGRSGRPGSLPPSAPLGPTAEVDPPEPQPLPRARASRAASSWQGIFASLFARVAVRDERAFRRRVGSASVVLGFGLAVVGLVLGLRGATANASFAPVVTASLIVARALAGLGMLAFGVTLLRIGERLLLGKRE